MTMNPFMKISVRLTVAGVLCLFSFAAATRAAQTITVNSRVIQSVNIRLTGYTQDGFDTHGDVEVTKFKAMRVTTKDILPLLATAQGKDFLNSQLVVTNLNFGSFLVLRGKKVLGDVSDLVTLRSTSELDFRDGTRDNFSGQGNYRRFLIGMVTFRDLAGNDFDVSGFVTDRLSGAAVDERGKQKVSDSVTVKASGTGHLLGQDVIFTGTITATGKGILQH